MTLWTPLEWFLRLLNMVGSIEFFPGITFFGVSIALLTIVLIFRMIIYPLTGGSVGSALEKAYDNSSFKKNRDMEKAYQRYKQSRDVANYHRTRYKNERK